MVSKGAPGFMIAATIFGYLVMVALYSFIGTLLIESCIKSKKVHNKQISDMEILQTRSYNVYHFVTFSFPYSNIAILVCIPG